MKYRTILLYGVTLLLALTTRVQAADDIILADFEGADYGAWKATGTAFGPGPARGDLPRQLEVEDWRGAGIASSERAGDGPTGTLTSPPFKIARRYISFLIAGGVYEHDTCLNLIMGGKTVRSATGWNSDRLIPVTWDVSQWQGQLGQLELVDQARGDWGHINVDQIIQTDKPEHPPVNAGPLYHEAHRPQFHFTARQWTVARLNPERRQEGWLNDLNGLIYYDGEYHLFAQRWNKCWIHAVSRDLVHWTELAPAFWEEQLDSGVQSGTCVIDYANTSGLSPSKATPPMIAFWSRNDNRSHCISYSLDHGRTWKNYEKNPILVYPERDPKVFWHAPSQHWVMFLSGLDGKYNILTSKNLLDWQDTRHVIPNSHECPDMFELPLDGDVNHMKWVLTAASSDYRVGAFDGKHFTSETPKLPGQRGKGFYAAQTFSNEPQGRRAQIGWFQTVTPGMSFNQSMSIPLELRLISTPDGPRLTWTPVKELEALRAHSHSLGALTLHDGDANPLAAINSELVEVRAEFAPGDAQEINFNVRGVPVVFDGRNDEIIVNGQHAPAPMRNGQQQLTIYADRTGLEVFTSYGRTFVPMPINLKPEDKSLALTVKGGTAKFSQLDVHELKSAWPAR